MVDTSRRLPRIAVMRNYNTVICLGKPENEARFEIKWNVEIADIKNVIASRVAAAHPSVRAKGMIVFPGQTPATGTHHIRHCTVQKLGCGAFGQVFKTVDAVSGDFIAVKMLKGPSNQNDPRWRQLIRLTRDREVGLVSQLNCPYIVQYLGSQGWSSGNVQIFMPMKAGTLHDLGERQQSPEQMADIAHAALLQMLAAIDFLELNGLVHRDLKPDNILYDVDRQGRYNFQLADFGQANLASKAKSMAGTIVYMAPEVHDNTFAQTSKVDVWSLFLTMAWFFNEGQFRDKLESSRMLTNQETCRIALEVAIGSHSMYFMRDMAIYEPKYRASAAQMLTSLDRNNMISSQPARRLPSNHFDMWMSLVTSGRSQCSQAVMSLLHPHGWHY